MDDEDDGDSYGGKGKTPKKKVPAKSPPVIKMSIHDDAFPTDLVGTTNTEFQWTDQDGVMRDVVDQGNRRVCWTIASSRELSGRLVVARRFDPPLRLSALHLLAGLIDKVDETGGLKELNHLRTFMINEGTVLEEDCKCPQQALSIKADPSKSNLIVCTLQNKAAKHVPRFKVQDMTIKNGADIEKEIMMLLKTGPVAVAIDVYPEFTYFKGDGIYPGPEKGSTRVDRHVLVVYGYGTLVMERIHYWKVQNSAGKKWGKDGCGKIIRQISRGEGQPSLFTDIVSAKLLDHYEGQRVQRGRQG